MSKRIAISCVGFPVLSETFILNQITGLIDQGYHVDIFPYFECSYDNIHEEVKTYNLQEHVYPVKIPPKNKAVRFLKCIYYLLKNIRHSPKLFRCFNAKKIGKPAVDLTAFYYALCFLNKKPYDYHFCHFGETAIRISLLKHIGFISGDIVTFYHGYDIHVRNNNELKQRQKEYALQFANGKLNVVNTAFSLKKVLDLGARMETCLICPVGLYIEESQKKYLQNKPGDGPLKILSIGRLIPLKGHEFALLAIKNIINSGFSNITYNIIGYGDNYERLTQRIKELGLGLHVFLLGGLRRQKVYEALEGCDIFLHPSVSDTDGRAETQGLVIQEAQLFGKPVVAFDSGGVAEGIGEQSGFVVAEKDTNALAEKLLILLKDANLRQKMGEKGMAFVKDKYDIKRLNNLVFSHL